jgi:hypothetical protein
LQQTGPIKPSAGGPDASGINYPKGEFQTFAEFALVEDHELIRQRNWDEAQLTSNSVRFRS